MWTLQNGRRVDCGYCVTNRCGSKQRESSACNNGRSCHYFICTGRKSIFSTRLSTDSGKSRDIMDFHISQMILVLENAGTHTHNCFTALWILSGTSRVSRYQKKHYPFTLIVVIKHPYLLSPSTTIHGVLSIQSTCFTVFFHNLCPSFL